MIGIDAQFAWAMDVRLAPKVLIVYPVSSATSTTAYEALRQDQLAAVYKFVDL